MYQVSALCAQPLDDSERELRTMPAPAVVWEGPYGCDLVHVEWIPCRISTFADIRHREDYDGAKHSNPPRQ